MITLATHQTLCRQFGSLLSYPSAEAAATASAAAAVLGEILPAAAAPLERFGRFLHSHEPARVEEIFTATFDLQPVCYPYVGYQLCGESQQRGLFLMQLQQLYRRHGFVAGVELPDHVATVLRFLGNVDEPECRRELVEDGLLPALAKLRQGLEGETQPYADLLDALHSFLTETVATEPESLAVNC